MTFLTIYRNICRFPVVCSAFLDLIFIAILLIYIITDEDNPRPYVITCGLLPYTYFLVLWPSHTTLELVACIMTATKVTMDIAGVFSYEDSGPGSMVLCILIDGGTVLTMGLTGGIACVVIITLDRY